MMDHHSASKIEQFSADLLNGSLDDESQQRLGHVHPHFMGGAYLPSYGRQEVEIARVELGQPHQTSLASEHGQKAPG